MRLFTCSKTYTFELDQKRYAGNKNLNIISKKINFLNEKLAKFRAIMDINSNLVFFLRLEFYKQKYSMELQYINKLEVLIEEERV